MASILSSLAGLFSRAKKRHNPENENISLSRPLSRNEFLSVYESMPESARVKLFASLGPTQKERLLFLLSGPPEKQAARPAPDDVRWDAEDFLPEKDERKIAKLRHVQDLRELKNVYRAVEGHPPAHLAEILAAESPAIAAMVLLQVGQKYASRVLKVLPELRRGEVVRAMASERQVVSEALVAVAKKISTKLEKMSVETNERVDGVKHVNEILKLLNVNEAERITREVSQHDAELGHSLEQSRYSFEDLAGLSARDFRTLFSSIPDEDLWARALKALDGGQRKAMLGKLPIKRAGIIVNAMAEIKATRLDGIDKARSQILQQARRLADRSEIRFAGNQLWDGPSAGSGMH